MKFYLDGKLVRTSKTHAYTHALTGTEGIVYSCHGSYDQAVKAMNRILAQKRQNAENAEAAVRAIDAGQTTYWFRYGRETWKAKITEPREYYADYAAQLKGAVAGMVIRELEAR